MSILVDSCEFSSSNRNFIGNDFVLVLQQKEGLIGLLIWTLCKTSRWYLYPI